MVSRMVILFSAAFSFSLTARAADNWKYDELYLKNGNVLKGIVLDESDEDVRFRNVRRSPGTPTVVITTTIAKDEILRIVRLSKEERAELAEKLAKLDPTGKGELAKMEELKLQMAKWVDKKQDAFEYRSTYFILLSNAQEDTVRRAAVRLEQIYLAYTQYLPPRRKQAEPTSIILARSLAEYRKLLQAQGRNILNPAFYDMQRNQVVCASELQEWGDELERVRQKHRKILADLARQEQELIRKFGAVPAFVRTRIAQTRNKIYLYNKKNDQLFAEVTHELFRTLYHEAFHAYLANFVYHPSETAVPRWLNEGLAQIFETAIVEADELRVGHVDRVRLQQVHEAARKGELLPLSTLLRSGAKDFLVAHANEKEVSDRYYFNSWALAFYLTFDQKLLGKPQMHRYVESLKRGTDDLEAFRQLVGKPISQFEKEYHIFLRGLRYDGTAYKPRR
ncbi:MAG: hypothetical protein KatS3mg105_2027 [Gemmatales bacterium]|nr:MAG: hypothetical protein KatS3mg105_2027 [Gemmatales bacterium]